MRGRGGGGGGADVTEGMRPLETRGIRRGMEGVTRGRRTSGPLSSVSESPVRSMKMGARLTAGAYVAALFIDSLDVDGSIVGETFAFAKFGS